MKNEQTENAKPCALVRQHEDLQFAVLAEPYGHYVEFKVYEIEGEDDHGRIMYHEAGADSSPSPVATMEESEPYLHGSVTWDGCSNWHFDEQERVMLHGCSRQDLIRFGEIMARCWDWAKELIPNFDGEDGGKLDAVQPPKEAIERSYATLLEEHGELGELEVLLTHNGETCLFGRSSWEQLIPGDTIYVEKGDIAIGPFTVLDGNARKLRNSASENVIIENGLTPCCMIPLSAWED